MFYVFIFVAGADVCLGDRIKDFRQDYESQISMFIVFIVFRLAEGIDTNRFERLSGAPLDAEKLDSLQEIGMISLENHRLRATSQGRAVLNAVLRELIPG